MSKVFLFVEVRVQPGKAESFLEELKRQIEIIRIEPGCEAIDIYRNTVDENLVHVWEVWSTRSLWDAHMTNQASKRWKESAASYVLGEKITIMDQLSS